MSLIQETTQQVLGRCRALGFALAGVAEARPTKYGEQYLAWIGASKHGEMAYLARNIEKRMDVRTMLPGAGAKSIICVADRYGGEGIEASRHQGIKGGEENETGKIARYARGDDYHVVMKKRLHRLADELAEQFPDETFRVCVDTAPVLEREHAQRAGLGAVGKHTLLIQEGVGSYVLLGEIITTLALAPTPSAEGDDPCGSCTRCIDACPTSAITPWSVDATRCISYLTIEHRGPIGEQFHEAMGDWIFGCDVCQEVCPHNQPTVRTTQAEAHDAYAPRREGFDLLTVLGWDEGARRVMFRKSPMKRAKLPMMKRNALIAAGNVLVNADGNALRAQIEAIAQDESECEIVRTTAEVVLEG
ncbi:MAG: tRNA epoxyqueuosine(34) reductase QueG [Planctomycetes bacterium]|nr:tRNA epoxyqueuosine(34) reductase QueG [Planctomycetota bacterium]